MTIPVPQEPDDPREIPRSIDADGNVVFGRLGIQEMDPSARWGASVTSTSQNDISVGLKYFTLDIDSAKHRVGDDVIIYSPDPDCFMWGEIVGRDTVTSPARILVYVDDISDVIGQFQEWEIQVVARPKPGIEKDTSTSSVDPTGAGPFTFTVTAGKFWPLGGTLLIKPTADRTIALLGKVKAYSSTSLVVEKTFTNATVSTSYTSWAIALLDAPTTALALDERQGLTIKRSGSAGRFDVTKGRIRDSTDTIDLVWDAATDLDCDRLFDVDATGVHIRVAGAGTVSSAGTAVTGTGTNFTTIFDTDGTVPLSTLYDYGTTLLTDRFPALSQAAVRYVISTDVEAVGVAVAAITNTSLTTVNNLGASGEAWYRGGIASPSTVVWYIVGLARHDTTAATRIFLSSFTPSGVPDKPSGYTYYRIIGVVSIDLDSNLADIIQENSLIGESIAANTNTYARPFTSLTPTANSDAVLRESGGEVGFGTVATAGVANDAISNAKLANMAAYTLKMRNAGTTGDPSDVALTDLTEKTALADADLFLIADSAASNAFKRVQKSNVSTSPFSSGNLFIAASL